MTDQVAGSVERRGDIKDSASLFTFWKNAIDLAGKEDETFLKTGDKAAKLYAAEQKVAFNILHSNTETLAPALYNSTPVPDVRTRHNDRDELARKGSQLIERGVSYQVDEYDFDAVVEAAVLDMLVPGRGVMRVRYTPYLHRDADYGGEQVVWEEVQAERVPWRRFRHGPGASWKDVPWVAFELFLTRDELEQLAPDQTDPVTGEPIPGTGIGAKVTLDHTESEDTERKDELQKSVYGRSQVWEIWDKETRKVYFIAPCYPQGPIAVEDDPLGLLEFFPMPRPLVALADLDKQTPVTPYEIYRKQADELSEVSTRILKLIGALKFRGVRAAEIAELESLDSLEDGQFIASKGALSLMGGNKGLDDAIWVMPLDKLIVVVRELIAQREAIKAAIYEITGISDILRGSTRAAETATAQQIKSQWGSLRIQKMQKRVERACRDIFRLKAEIIANKFSPETLAMIAGEEVAPEVIELLRNDIRRCYLVDVETDSTVRGDLVRAQQSMAEFLQGSAQFMQTFVPLLQSEMLPPQVGMVAIEIYAGFARQFKLGKAAEDAIAQLSEAAAGLAKQQQEQGDQDKQRQEQVEDETRQIQKAKVEADIRKSDAQAQAAVIGAQTNQLGVQVKAQQAQQQIQAQAVETAAIAGGQIQQGFVS
jgi:hypothetical protein